MPGHSGTLWGWALQGDSCVGHAMAPWRLCTLIGQCRRPGHSGTGHSRETLGLGNSQGRPWWALRGHSGLGTLGLGTPVKGWALPGLGTRVRGHSGVGHSERLRLNSGALSFWHSRETWALQGHSRVGQFRDERGIDGRGEELSLGSNNPTPRVRKTQSIFQGKVFNKSEGPRLTICHSGRIFPWRTLQAQRKRHNMFWVYKGFTRIPKP